MIMLTTVEDFYERNVRMMDEHADKDRWFGMTYVQRICRIGYNQSCHTIEHMLNQGLIEQNPKCEWQYRYLH
jgi:DNA segregation ATPase FtsK/SpoIIIE-like protein